MLNKSGPSIEPCGTPAIIFSQELKLVLTRTRCVAYLLSNFSWKKVIYCHNIFNFLVFKIFFKSLTQLFWVYTYSEWTILFTIFSTFSKAYYKTRNTRIQNYGTPAQHRNTGGTYNHSHKKQVAHAHSKQLFTGHLYDACAKTSDIVLIKIMTSAWSRN